MLLNILGGHYPEQGWYLASAKHCPCGKHPIYNEVLRKLCPAGEGLAPSARPAAPDRDRVLCGSVEMHTRRWLPTK